MFIACSKPTDDITLSTQINPIAFLQEGLPFNLAEYDTTQTSEVLLDTLVWRPIWIGDSAWKFVQRRGSNLDTLSFMSLPPLLVINQSIIGIYEPTPAQQIGFLTENCKVIDTDTVIRINGQTFDTYFFQKTVNQKETYWFFADRKYQNPVVRIYRIIDNQPRLWRQTIDPFL